MTGIHVRIFSFVILSLHWHDDTYISLQQLYLADRETEFKPGVNLQFVLPKCQSARCA